MAGGPTRGRPRSMRRWQFVLAVVVLLMVGAGVAEVAARCLGVDDFPVYDADPALGYVPAANQNGAFLNRNRWAFNDRHMGTARPFAPGKSDILLVGDSIVYGGNMVDQPDKLGPSLEQATGCKVWPLAAGSWALLNELAAIRQQPDVTRLGTIIFVLNSGDFGKASVWRNPYSHPRNRPRLSSVFAVHKKFFPVRENVKSAPSKMAAAQWRRELSKLSSTYTGKMVFVRFPNREELAAQADRFPAEVIEPAKGASINPMDDGRWGPELYRDDIHPSAEGNRVLAGIIADQVPACPAAGASSHR